VVVKSIFVKDFYVWRKKQCEKVSQRRIFMYGEKSSVKKYPKEAFLCMEKSGPDVAIKDGKNDKSRETEA